MVNKICPYLADLRPIRRIFAISLSNLADLRTILAKNLRIRNGLGKVRTRFLALNLRGLSQIWLKIVTSLSEIADC